jgi:hypothetical protein
MPRRAAFLVTTGVGLLTAVLLRAGAAPEGAGGVDRILPAHPLHAQNGVPCEACHALAPGSRAGSDNLLPAMETCGDCHDISDAQACGQCHTQPAHPGAAPRVTAIAQKFPHAAHLGEMLTCTTCHGPVEAEPHLPEKALCRTCHETASGQSDCGICHAEGEPWRPASHAPGWASFHATAGRVNGAACADCHTQSDCQECHAGDNVRLRVHPLNYVYSHALEARGQELSCSACHEDVQFCQACHAAEQVLPESHSRADWVSRRGGGRHAEEAEFDLESCAACHDAGAPVCVQCHGR